MKTSNRTPRESAGGSDRSFCFLFAVVLAIVALWPLRSSLAPRWWALMLSAGLLAAGLLRPSLLRPANRLWTRFGLLLHRLTSPIVTAVIFYALITPTGIIMRLLGRDPLRLRFDRSSATYWLPRNPPGPLPNTMRNQF
jgi:hypothetical protein